MLRLLVRCDGHAAPVSRAPLARGALNAAARVTATNGTASRILGRATAGLSCGAATASLAAVASATAQVRTRVTAARATSTGERRPATLFAGLRADQGDQPRVSAIGGWIQVRGKHQGGGADGDADDDDEELDLDMVTLEMEDKIEAMRTHLAALRTGRAAPSLLDKVTVDAYGAPAPLLTVAQITIKDPQLLAVVLFDESLVDAVQRGIMEADLGFNPYTKGGKVVFVPVPRVTGDLRRKLLKTAAEQLERTKVSIRNIRRDANSKVRKADLPKDEARRMETAIQAATDDAIAAAVKIFEAKEKDIEES